MRLIDADVLRKQFEDRTLEDFTCYHFLSAIDNAPTVDMNTELSVAYLKGRRQGQSDERPQGEWIPNEKSIYSSLFSYNSGRHCSICGRVVEFSENYCPKCGADMRGD